PEQREELAGDDGERDPVERHGRAVALDEAGQGDGAGGAGPRFRQRISRFHFSVHCGRCLATCPQSNRISLSTSFGPLLIFFAPPGSTFTVLLVGLQKSSVAKASCTSGEM